MKPIIFAAALAAVPLSAAADAILPCEKSLTRDHFDEERKQLQKALQSNIYKYRMLESTSAGTPEGKAEMANVMSEINVQKTTFKDLDSKYFPRTPVTAFGAACSDRRWLEGAKEKLVEKPEHLGKHWYVWLDKTTRKPSAALARPSFDVMAE